MDYKEIDLEGVSFVDIVFRENEKGNILYFICENIEIADRLYKILSEYVIEVKLAIDQSDKITVRMNFLETKYYLSVEIEKFYSSYHPTDLILAGNFGFVNTAITGGQPGFSISKRPNIPYKK